MFVSFIVSNLDDLIYTALSSGESAKVKRDKKSKSSSTQTDQSKIKGSTRKIQFLHPHMSGKNSCFMVTMSGVGSRFF